MGLEDNKITIIENREVNIYNYGLINLLEETKIIIGNYIIIGENLKITELDGYQVKILGEIKEIKFNNE